MADWATRALGWLVDTGFSIAISIVGRIGGAIIGAVSGALGALISLLFGLVGLAYLVIQLVKQGNTGQTVGKKIVGLMVINESTGQPIGPGLSIVRYIAHIADVLTCFVGYLFPLWDPKRQTFADKIMGTVVVTVPKQPFNPQDLYTTT